MELKIGDYQVAINLALNSIKQFSVLEALRIIEESMLQNKPIFLFGNGGSAAIADHFATDLAKGLWTDTDCHVPVISLVSNAPMMTALANDEGYAYAFKRQLQWCQHGYDGATVIAFSSSGNSPNIVEGLMEAKAQDMRTIAFVGFDGGNVMENDLADVIVHVDSQNYGVIEDVHMMLCHMIAQHLRTKYARPGAPLKL